MSAALRQPEAEEVRSEIRLARRTGLELMHAWLTAATENNPIGTGR